MPKKAKPANVVKTPKAKPANAASAPKVSPDYVNNPFEYAVAQIRALPNESREPYVRALFGSIMVDGENYESPSPESPQEIADRLELNLSSLHDFRIVISAEDA